MRKKTVKIYSNECEMKIKTDGTTEGESALTALLTSLAKSIGKFYYTSKIKGYKHSWHTVTIKNNKLKIKKRN